MKLETKGYLLPETAEIFPIVLSFSGDLYFRPDLQEFEKNMIILVGFIVRTLIYLINSIDLVYNVIISIVINSGQEK